MGGFLWEDHQKLCEEVEVETSAQRKQEKYKNRSSSEAGRSWLDHETECGEGGCCESIYHVPTGQSVQRALCQEAGAAMRVR